MQHLMIDIETLDTKPTAVILSVGAVLFDLRTGQNIEEAFMTLYVQQQLDVGRTVSEDTLRWWSRQDPAILHRQFPDERHQLVGPEIVYTHLHDLALNAEGVWGNGATFDNVILADYARMAGLADIWPHWKDRCFRTFAAIYDPKKLLRPNSASHDALEDAKLQVEWMGNIVREKNLSL